MNLRNYDNVIAAKQLIAVHNTYISQGEHNNFGDGHLTFKDKGANIRKISYCCGSSGYEGMRLPFSDSGYVGSGLICGSGDTPVTYDDYKLATEFTSNDISIVSIKYSDTTYDEATNSFKRTETKIFAAKQDLIIKEIGFSSGVYSNSSLYETLMFRKVLDEPISVQANSNFELTFTTTVSACANKPAEYEASVTTA